MITDTMHLNSLRWSSHTASRVSIMRALVAQPEDEGGDSDEHESTYSLDDLRHQAAMHMRVNTNLRDDIESLNGLFDAMTDYFDECLPDFEVHLWEPCVREAFDAKVAEWRRHALIRVASEVSILSPVSPATPVIDAALEQQIGKGDLPNMQQLEQMAKVVNGSFEQQLFKTRADLSCPEYAVLDMPGPSPPPLKATPDGKPTSVLPFDKKGSSELLKDNPGARAYLASAMLCQKVRQTARCIRRKPPRDTRCDLSNSAEQEAMQGTSRPRCPSERN